MRLLVLIVICWGSSGQFVLCLLEELNFSDISAVDGYHVNVLSLFHIRETGFAIDLGFGKVPSLTIFRDDPN